MLAVDFSNGVPDMLSLKELGVEAVFCDTFNSEVKTAFDEAIKAGLLFGLYQGYDPAVWTDATQASIRANNAIDVAKSIDYPYGCLIALDCEQSSSDAVSNTQWVATWLEAISSSGYQDGIYVGAGFNAEWAKVQSQIQWKSVSLSGVPNLYVSKPYHMYQVTNSTDYNGISVDFDVIISSDIHLASYTQSYYTLIKSASSASSTSSTSSTSSASSASSANTKIITVTSGFTLWGYAKGDWTLINKIMAMNHLKSANNLQIGQELEVPN